MILTFQNSFFRQIVSSGGWHRLDSPSSALGDFHVLETEGGLVGITGGFGVGSPAATNRLEDIAASGPRRFIAIGYAGTLQPDLRIGDVVLCERAIRDEGVSHHYVEPGRYSFPSAGLTASLVERLSAAGVAHRVGTTWTIDTPYRETLEELRHYRSEGVLTVEMEAAALAAVAQFRGLDFATAFAVSDSLTDSQWRPQFHHEDATAGLEALLKAAMDTLLASGPAGTGIDDPTTILATGGDEI